MAGAPQRVHRHFDRREYKAAPLGRGLNPINFGQKRSRGLRLGLVGEGFVDELRRHYGDESGRR
ncbi:MAG: hypothetical protein ICV85_21260 [Tolypothrix sp. T3-bin4]|nr:hypothetical protein [Tolypothrix sp. T3-bin4]